MTLMEIKSLFRLFVKPSTAAEIKPGGQWFFVIGVFLIYALVSALSAKVLPMQMIDQSVNLAKPENGFLFYLATVSAESLLLPLFMFSLMFPLALFMDVSGIFSFFRRFAETAAFLCVFIYICLRAGSFPAAVKAVSALAIITAVLYSLARNRAETAVFFKIFTVYSLVESLQEIISMSVYYTFPYARDGLFQIFSVVSALVLLLYYIKTVNARLGLSSAKAFLVILISAFASDIFIYFLKNIGLLSDKAMILLTAL